MNFAAVQLDIVWENKPTNHRRAEELIRQAAPAEGSLIILPEMFATGFSMNTAATLEAASSATESFLAQLAQATRCALVGGLVNAGKNGRPENQAVAFGPEGKELGRYSKMQPFSLAQEDVHYQAGTAPCVFEWQGWKVAPFVCYDLRFPELFRLAADEGAELMVVIANWPSARVEHWLTLLRARAIENQAWVIGVNRCGTDPKLPYPGRSVAIDPQGVIVADAGDGETVLQGPLSLETVRNWRAQFPALRDRQRWLEAQGEKPHKK